MSEQPVTPLPRVGVQHSVQILLGDGLGVDGVCHALHTFQPLQGLEQHSPGGRLAAAAGSHHHEAVVELGDLVELQYLLGGREGRGREGGRGRGRDGGTEFIWYR